VLAEQERAGGVSTHTSPLAHVGDAGSLLLNAGFKIPTVDTDLFHVNYFDAVEVCVCPSLGVC
jgi:NADH dehydrogenase [ubiquinone] 1 alpha subcomplex assembly factor 5